MNELTQSEREIMEHAIGWDSRSPLYRNHYVTAGGHVERIIAGLIGRGLMRLVRGPSERRGGSTYAVTRAGVLALAALPDQPKRTKRVAEVLRAKLEGMAWR